MTDLDVTRTYLEMTRRDQLDAVPLDRQARVERVTACTVPYFRFLYAEVGRRYHWRDRLVWSDAQWRARFNSPEIGLFVLFVDGTPAGYFELERHPSSDVEIVYFGLMEDFLGRGLGKQMLTAAVESAWAMGATRVWLHTCTLDNPAALPNYLKRGFAPFKTERYTVPAAPVPRSAVPPPA